jgi:hypothetical protein
MLKIEPSLMETIPPIRLHLSRKPEFAVVITPDAETAIWEAENATEYTQIFTDSSHIDGKVGVAADLWLGNFRDKQVRKHLAEERH